MRDLTEAEKNTGLHAFVFIDRVEPEGDLRPVINGLNSLETPGVLFAAEVIGSSIGFVHVRVDDENDLRGLQDLIFRDLWRRGLRCKHCIELATGRQGVKRDTPQIIAISKIRVARRGISDLIRDLEAPDSPVRDTLKGISVVTGDWDVLVQLNGDDFETVRNAVLYDLPQVPGILESDTLFTDGAYEPTLES
jgi:DNA-binding Lrp family transcriptional regulator